MIELLKALSWFPPIAFLAGMYEPDWMQNSGKVVYVLGGAVVFVPSFIYHTLCHFGKFEDLIDNKARRLDQSGQHVANALFAYALSGSALYFAFVAAVSVSAISLLWFRGAHDTPFYRRAGILATIGLSLAPMAWRGDYENLAGAVATAVFIITLFVLGGYCHSASHLLLLPYLYFIYKSVHSLECRDLPIPITCPKTSILPIMHREVPIMHPKTMNLMYLIRRGGSTGCERRKNTTDLRKRSPSFPSSTPANPKPVLREKNSTKFKKNAKNRCQKNA